MHTHIFEQTYDGRPIEFRLGASLLRGSHLMWLSVLVLGVPLAIALAFAFLAASQKGEPKGLADLLRFFSEFTDKDPSVKWNLWLLVALAPVLMIVSVLQRFAYIRLTSYGMEGYVPIWTRLGIGGTSTGRWQIYWESIRSIRLLPGKPTGKPVLDLKGYRLEIETERGSTRISPFSWIIQGGPDHRLSLWQIFRPKKLNVAEYIEQAPLVRALRASGLEFSKEAGAGAPKPGGNAGDEATTGFDLAKHPGLVVQLGLFFGAGLYAVGDTFFVSAFQALEALPVEPFLAVALIGAVLVFALGRGAPVVERWAVGVLTVAALTAAVHPALLRFNAATAQAQEVAYRAVGAGRFEPMAGDLPSIDLRALGVDEYWAQYPAGAEYEFRLLRGDGGFYQVDLAPVYAHTRAFYSDKR